MCTKNIMDLSIVYCAKQKYQKQFLIANSFIPYSVSYLQTNNTIFKIMANSTCNQIFDIRYINIFMNIWTRQQRITTPKQHWCVWQCVSIKIGPSIKSCQKDYYFLQWYLLHTNLGKTPSFWPQAQLGDAVTYRL